MILFVGVLKTRALLLRGSSSGPLIFGNYQTFYLYQEPYSPSTRFCAAGSPTTPATTIPGDLSDILAYAVHDPLIHESLSRPVYSFVGGRLNT